MQFKPPVLYSFRRCPYAMRARMAIASAGIEVELREVVLKNKPQALLDISAKATVPVLQIAEQQLLDESLEIMDWALTMSDVNSWQGVGQQQEVQVQSLIDWNDNEFKYYLDRYKYADRYPEHSPENYRIKAETFLAELESRLRNQAYLCGDSAGLADVAIFPFIRQFAMVDKAWFDSNDYPKLRHWLYQWLETSLFSGIMKKYPAWQPGMPPILTCFKLDEESD